MNKNIMEPRYITDEKGKRVSVVLDIKFYRALTEELEDMHDTLKAEHRLASSKKTHSLEEVKKRVLATTESFITSSKTK